MSWSPIIVLIIVVVVVWWLITRFTKKEPSDIKPHPVEEQAPAAALIESQEQVSAVQVVESVPEAEPSVAKEANLPVETTPVSLSPDDLTVIEGIGPKIDQALKRAGIMTFADLANSEVQSIQEILLAENFRLADPETWPEQARLAAEGKLDELVKFQAGLKGGRRV